LPLNMTAPVRVSAIGGPPRDEKDDAQRLSSISCAHYICAEYMR
jgi:hypothetical protein